MTTATETIEQLANREYKYGFVTDIESRDDSQGPERGRRPADLGEEERAGVAARVAPQGVPALADDGGAELAATSSTTRSTTRTSSTTRRRRRRQVLNSLDEVDPEVRATFEKLGIPLDEQKLLAGVAVDAVFDSVSVATTFREKLASMGIIFMLVLRGGARASGAGEEVSRLGRAVHRQLLRRAELGGLQRRLVRATSPRACAARWSCRPTSASTPRTPASSSGR